MGSHDSNVHNCQDLQRVHSVVYREPDEQQTQCAHVVINTQQLIAATSRLHADVFLYLSASALYLLQI